MKKVLFTATVDSHILHFHIPYLKLLKDNGYEVHVATNTDEPIEFCDVKYKISFERNPFKINNIKAIKDLKKIIDKEKFDLIHCHTPMGSVVTRLAAKESRKTNNTRLIYTAHGFHFYKGASILNWLLFYPIEKYLSKYTDDLVTINTEDYELAKRKFKTTVHYIPGVGIDENKFNFEMTDREKLELRQSLGLKQDDFVILQIGELNKNKNQIMSIKAMSQLVKENINIHLLLAGKGSLENFYKDKVKQSNLDKNIRFLGYRGDIPKLLKVSSLAVSTSKREGLPVNILEAMQVGLPCVVTNGRGNRDLIQNGENGYVTKIDYVDEFANKVLDIYKNKALANKFSENNLKEVKKYQLNEMLEEFKGIYKI